MKKVALLIGVSEYDDPALSPLPAAVKDVDAMADILQDPERGQFSTSDITVLKNPDKPQMEVEIEKLFSKGGKDDLVLLYFSGHGIKDERGKLCLATRIAQKDTQGELIRASVIPAALIHEFMGYSRSKRQVVILDSCFSGAFVKGLLTKDDGKVDIRGQLGGEGRGILASSNSTQYSFEQKGEDLSIYTRFLIEGIRTGDADRDGNGTISIDDLHQYVYKKVKEIYSAMTPEISATGEGYGIQLAKAIPPNPAQQYRKLLERYAKDGKISYTARRKLDSVIQNLRLDNSEADSIENDVVGKQRREFDKRCQEYEQIFSDLLDRSETIGKEDKRDLQKLQDDLKLEDGDIEKLEVETRHRLKIYKESLQLYEKDFSDAIRQKYPMPDETYNHLAQVAQKRELKKADIKSIEERIISEAENYHQRLKHYEAFFSSVTKHEYPITEVRRDELRRRQQELSLLNEDIERIEAQITEQIESYKQKLRQYEQDLVRMTRCKAYITDSDRKQLSDKYKDLNLDAADISEIEARVDIKIKTFHENLKKYEQEFNQAVNREYPLSEQERNQLDEFQKDLGLDAEDVNQIEACITALIEE
jgi:uncharacterized caspase-like protein